MTLKTLMDLYFGSLLAMLQENQLAGFPTRFDTNQAVQPQKIVKGLKCWIYKVEGLYYLCSENKGTDQLHGYGPADMRPQKPGFRMTCLNSETSQETLFH